MATSSAPLFVPNVTLQAARGASPPSGSIVVGTPIVGNIFTNGVEEGSFDASITAQGAGWDRAGSTTVSIVRDDQYSVCNDFGPLEPPVGPVTGREWESSPLAPADGSHAVRTRFGASAAGGEAWSEMRFKLGTFEEPDVWLAFDLRVPINFYHRSAAGTDNNKLIRLFHSDYGSGGKCGMEFTPDGTGGSSFYLQSDLDGDAQSRKVSGSFPFVSVPDDRGRWMRLVFHARSETSPLAGDGLLQIYRRWENESTFSLVGEVTNAKLQRGDGVVSGFNRGYLMGYSNSGYDSDTEWLLDNFAIGTEAMV